MKNFFAILAVALATLQCASALSCYECGIEPDSTCEADQKLLDCVTPESADPVATAVNCYAAEIIQAGTKTTFKGCLVKNAAPVRKVHPTEIKMDGCVKITEANIEGFYCVCSTNECNKGEPKDLDDCESGGASGLSAIFLMSITLAFLTVYLL